MHKQSGMVLGISLIILFILSLLAVNGFQTNLQQIKMVQHGEQYQQNFYKAETVLKQIETSLNKEQTHCMIKDPRANIFGGKSRKWWQEYSCDLDSVNYVTQDLGEDDKQCHQYYRITARATNAKHQYPVALQTTIVKPTGQCESETPAKRISWRQLSLW